MSDEQCQDEEVASLRATVERQRRALEDLVMERDALKGVIGIEAAEKKRLERQLQEAQTPARRRAVDRG